MTSDQKARELDRIARKWLTDWLWCHSSAETFMPDAGVTDQQLDFMARALAAYAQERSEDGSQCRSESLPLEHCPKCWSGRKDKRFCPLRHRDGMHVNHDSDCQTCNHEWHKQAESRSEGTPADINSKRQTVLESVWATIEPRILAMGSSEYEAVAQEINRIATIANAPCASFDDLWPNNAEPTGRYLAHVWFNRGYDRGLRDGGQNQTKK